MCILLSYSCLGLDSTCQACYCHALSTLWPLCAVLLAGLDDRSITGPALLEADQGDVISGKLSRDEAAETVVAALTRADAAYKTLELRQNEAADAQGKPMSEAAFTRLFLKLALGETDLTACVGMGFVWNAHWGLRVWCALASNIFCKADHFWLLRQHSMDARHMVTCPSLNGGHPQVRHNTHMLTAQLRHASCLV